MKMLRKPSGEILVQLQEEELKLFGQVFSNQAKGVKLIIDDWKGEKFAFELMPMFHELSGIAAELIKAAKYPYLIKSIEE